MESGASTHRIRIALEHLSDSLDYGIEILITHRTVFFNLKTILQTKFLIVLRKRLQTVLTSL
jgi:hypothetical protein